MESKTFANIIDVGGQISDGSGCSVKLGSFELLAVPLAGKAIIVSIEPMDISRASSLAVIKARLGFVPCEITAIIEIG